MEYSVLSLPAELQLKSATSAEPYTWECEKNFLAAGIICYTALVWQ